MCGPRHIATPCLPSDQNIASHVARQPVCTNPNTRRYHRQGFHRHTKVMKTLSSRQHDGPRHATINRKHLSLNRNCYSLIGPGDSARMSSQPMGARLFWGRVYKERAKGLWTVAVLPGLSTIDLDCYSSSQRGTEKSDCTFTHSNTVVVQPSSTGTVKRFHFDTFIKLSTT